MSRIIPPVSWCVGALTLLATALVPGTSSAEDSAAPAPVELGGHNTITGSESGTRIVHLATPAELTWQAFPMGLHDGMTASGDGRAVGFALAPVENVPAPDGRFVLRSRMGWCDSPGCPVQEDPMQCACDWFESGATGFDRRVHVWPDGTHDHRVLLGPGAYVLTLVADGAPATVTFTLYEPSTMQPLPGASTTEVDPDPASVAMSATVHEGIGVWETSKNFEAGAEQGLWFVATWAYPKAGPDDRMVGGPAWLCDYPGGRNALSSPCPASVEQWSAQGNVQWRGFGLSGWSGAATFGHLSPAQTHGLGFLSVVPFSTAPFARGFLTIQI